MFTENKIIKKLFKKYINTLLILMVECVNIFVNIYKNIYTLYHVFKMRSCRLSKYIYINQIY